MLVRTGGRTVGRGRLAFAAFVALALLGASKPSEIPGTPQPNTKHDAQQAPKSNDHAASQGQIAKGLPVATEVATSPSYLQRYSEYCASAPDAENDKWRHKFWCEFTISDAVIAAFTVFSVMITFLLVCVGAWQVSESRQSTQRQLRAYVSGHPKFISSSDATTVPWAEFEIQNAGQTPARRMRHVAVIKALPFPLAAGFVPPPFERPRSPETSLSSKVPMTGKCSAERPFTADEIARIRDGRFRIYVYGTITYEDIFAREQETKFGSSVRADALTLERLTSNYLPSDLTLYFEVTPLLNDFT
jgi:hypothetical protein